MKVLVTGGAGYVGSTLIPLLLAEGHQVRVIDELLHDGQSLLGAWAHPNFEFSRADIRDIGAVREALVGIDGVVHLAAIVGDPACSRQPDLARQVNLEASLLLLEESRKGGVRRFVFASTCSNYGKMSDAESYVEETSELRPVSLYAETKVAVERAILGSHDREMGCTVLRFATIFGVSPRMRFDLTVNEFTLDLLTKRHLIVFGEQFWRPYIHVRDAARAIVLVLAGSEQSVPNEVFNVGSTRENYQKLQLVDMIRPYAPDAKVEFVHKEEDPRNYRVSFAKIKEKLGFDVTLDVSCGIREVARLVENGIITETGASIYRN
jgi:nucleoside-diphosphate-sugar epimerase